MDISVKPAEINSFSQNLRQWAQSMKMTQNQIVQRTRSLQSEWKDPQYAMFVETTQNHANMLKSSIDQFEKMSQQLALMARELEQTQRMMKQRIDKMR